MDEEGIFRKSGSLNRIKEIQNLYNMGQPVAYEGLFATYFNENSYFVNLTFRIIRS